MAPSPEIQPRDELNLGLLANVHPHDWRNPTPRDRYNLVVIGAGTAGLITAAVAAGLGARVALVERHLLGGDCLNVGCVPSKALIRQARRVQEARSAQALGLGGAAASDVDFGEAMRRMREVRTRISEDDSARRYRDELGVDVFLGEARFTGPDRVDVDGASLRFRKAVVATGARAAAPPIEGLEDAGYLTNESVFELTERPRRLAVIGGGPIGCELAQAFQRLGSQVVLLNDTDHVLNREDADAAAIVQAALRRDGVELVLGCRLEKVSRNGTSRTLRYTCPDGPGETEVDQILVAVGRAPNVQSLGLEEVDVEYDDVRGIRVDDFLRTTNRRIYAAGDVAMAWKFTHAADAAAKIVVQNALFFRRQRVSSLVMPWCTYTDPEIAHVGLYETQARAKGLEVETHQIPLERVNRAVCDGEEEGFVKVHVRKGSDRILGATIVASHAGEMISEIGLAIVGGLGLAKVAQVIHPYPTQAEGIKAAANAHLRTRLTPRVKGLFERFLAWTR
jgi:pyruvate/2-oxoglutarate dehydrogenase complex dihydrolipoamide dehydrogenase (E3) component